MTTHDRYKHNVTWWTACSKIRNERMQVIPSWRHFVICRQTKLVNLILVLFQIIVT